MTEILMVDGYGAPFDGVKAKKRAKRRAKKHGQKRSAAWLCAGAKRLAACKRAVSSARRAKARKKK